MAQHGGCSFMLESWLMHVCLWTIIFLILVIYKIKKFLVLFSTIHFSVSEWISAEILLLFFTDNVTPSWMLYAVSFYGLCPHKSWTYCCANNGTTTWNATEDLFYSPSYILGRLMNEVRVFYHLTLRTLPDNVSIAE